MSLPDDLLDRPAPDAVRHVALDFLRQAAEARERLGDPSDAEALHDFRVAIRRLRSTVRAHAGHHRERAAPGQAVCRVAARRHRFVTGEGHPFPANR